MISLFGNEFVNVIEDYERIKKKNFAIVIVTAFLMKLSKMEEIVYPKDGYISNLII